MLNKPASDSLSSQKIRSDLRNSLLDSMWGGNIPPRYRKTMTSAGSSLGTSAGKGNGVKPLGNRPPSQWTFQPNPLDQAPQQPPMTGGGGMPPYANPPMLPWMYNPMNPQMPLMMWGQQQVPWQMQNPTPPQTGGPGPVFDPTQQPPQPQQAPMQWPSYGWGWAQQY